MKRCSSCKELIPFTHFKISARNKDGYQTDCISCRKEYNRKWYLKNQQRLKSKAQSRNKEYYESNTDLINAHKDVPCKDCNVKYNSWQMDFDHLENKSWDVSQMKHHSPKTVLKEIQKCEVVCSNCHRNRTYNRRLLAQLGRVSVSKTEG